MKKLSRTAVCILLVVLVCVIFEARLFQWQIVEGDEFLQQAMINRSDGVELDGARGEILDRNGSVLAGNRTSYNIVMNALKMDYDRRNAVIISVIDILKERGEEWRDRLPIVLLEDGSFAFKEDAEDEVSTLKAQDGLNLADYASAEECMDALCEYYGCEGYSSEDARNVASVRYGMTRDGFSRTNPYVIARDVSSETVAVISQLSDELPGVEPSVAAVRYYGEEGSLAPHILGTVGAISGEEYDRAVQEDKAYDPENNLSGYKWTDTVGVGGLEEAFEEDLRGERGIESIYTDDNGELVRTAVTTQPKEGNSLKLTLDSDLQRAANFSLKENIERNTGAADCTAGAVVALNVKDFGVLACSSYPTYDLNRYTQDDDYYNMLVEDENSPLFNRALNGVFVPGSIFKPLVALAALQEGTITAGTSYYCGGEFEYYDMVLKCTSSYGYFDVYSALEQSCNTYFCNVGVNLGIDILDAYAEYFGLGEKTGVELSEDSGIMSGPQEYSEQHAGAIWTGGVTAQTAIGQADNMFTPIQLADYCATIANGGKRLRVHFLDSVTDYTGEKTVRKYEPEELYDAGLSQDVLGIVREGMRMAGISGTASDTFSDYPISVACKTGTAETSGGHEANISFICYAPADDPEIAVAVMLEYGNKGDYARRVAKDVLDEYFGFATWDAEGNHYDSDGNRIDYDGEITATAEELAGEREETPSPGDPLASPSPSRDSDIPTVPFGSGEEPVAAASPSPAPQDGPSSPYYHRAGTYARIPVRSKG